MYRSCVSLVPLMSFNRCNSNCNIIYSPCKVTLFSLVSSLADENSHLRRTNRFSLFSNDS